MSEVRVLERKYVKGNKEYRSYYVVIPSNIARAIGIKRGDVLKVLLKEVEVGGSPKIALVYYKPM